MNKVITINLNGVAFQLEENGYNALRAYLDEAAAKLANNPDRDEIMADIERAIADKFRAVLSAYKTVVVTREIEAVIAEMGPVDDGSGEVPVRENAGTGADTAQRGAAAAASRPGKRLYKISEGAMFAGVCSGLGAYFGIDPTIVRLVFAVLTILTSGFWILVYLVMMFVVPSADTAEEKAAAFGSAPFTTQEFIRRAREGYYEGMKHFHDREARRAWKRRFKRDMQAWGHWFQWEMGSGAQNWRRYWAQNLRVAAPGWHFAAPFFSLLRATLALGALAVLVSLLSTGGLFGHGIPGALPVWVAVILLFIAWGVVTVPLKAAQHAYYYYGGCGPRAPWFHVWDALVWIGFLCVLGWLAFHHGTEVREAIHNVPVTVHSAIDAVRDWWHSK
jgi:phage shock protein PspC (stress-responsive transcriptional regulator)